MKYLVTESQLRTLNKENINRGKYGEMIEKMITEYIGPTKVCDIVAMASERDENFYLCVVLVNNYVPYNLSGKVKKFIETFMPIELFINIDEKSCNPHNLF